MYSLFFSKVGNCDNPNFHDAGRVVALMDRWIIEYMADQKLIVPDNVIVVGQSAGGWAAIALSSENVPGVRAIVTFAAGRGGRVGGKPNNNCAPDRLVAATGEFGRTARIPMLWIYIENDTFFGPELSRRMHEAYTEAGGNAEYHLLPAVRQRRTFSGQFARRPSVVDAAGRGIPGQAQIDRHRRTMEAIHDKAAVPPIPRPTQPGDSTAGPDAAGFRHWDCIRATGCEAGRQPGKREYLPARSSRLRGQRTARDIKYSDWRKVCFKTPGTNLVCRTSISGTFETGQSAVRIDLIEREGDKAARLQMFLPVGLYLQAGVKITIDQGAAYRFPYVWCLTNTCIAADLADPKLIKEMETGQKLLLEVVDYQRLDGKHDSADQSVRCGSAGNSDADVRARYR